MESNERPRRLLVVEDNPTDVLILHRVLKAHGVEYEMTVMEDGEQAIEYLGSCEQGHTPDLIVIDVNLPKEDGLGVLLKYRFRPALSKIPIVILTSSDAANDRSRAEMLGADVFLRKPIELEDFLSIGGKIRQLLERPPGTRSAA